MSRAPSRRRPSKAPAPTGPAIPGPQTPDVEIPDELAVLPLRETVVFPGTVMPLSVGRPASLKLLEQTLPQNKVIALVTQKSPETESAGRADIHDIGTAATVLKLIRESENAVTVLVHALGRIRLGEVTQTEPFLRARIEKLTEHTPEDKQMTAAFKLLRDTAIQLAAASGEMGEQFRTIVEGLDRPGQLADFLAANLDVEIAEKQDLLEELDVGKRSRMVQVLLSREVEIAQLQRKIHEDVQSTLTEAQRKAYLREQARAIQRELGEEGGVGEQVQELRRKLDEAKLPEAVREEVDRELRRMESMHPASPEYSMVLTYLEMMAELPWSRMTTDNLDLKHAQQVLDRDHHDLEKVKRRLIEYLAVRKLNPTGRSPILCLLGPPGVGKTSLGQSVADALGRKFVRLALGGVRDEADVRGHRRTYIGSMPGRLIQELRRAGTRNPVMMLDEIDKLGADFRGDPASALLEVLDPKQNSTFVDRYLDVPFDLSQVLFIATANYMDPVPAALRDRMEIIHIPGYTDTDKLRIAERYLVPRQREENGLKKNQIRFTKPALQLVIDGYSREAGVRELERQIGALCRSIAAKVASGDGEAKYTITPETVGELLGPRKYVREAAQQVGVPGVVTGLAYTPFGGEVLFVEATRYPGGGKFQLTGQLGAVMKESVQTALSLVRSRAEALGVEAKRFNEFDFHVHVPAGAVPKDGPSAGVAMFTALASLMMERAVRADLAMTGEVTLRGLVLPIGGLKEKTLAALRAGIKTVLIPEGNAKDIPELPSEVRKKLKIKPVKTVDQVLEAALHPAKRTRKPAKAKTAESPGKSEGGQPAVQQPSKRNGTRKGRVTPPPPPAAAI